MSQDTAMAPGSPDSPGMIPGPEAAPPAVTAMPPQGLPPLPGIVAAAAGSPGTEASVPVAHQGRSVGGLVKSLSFAKARASIRKAMGRDEASSATARKDGVAPASAPRRASDAPAPAPTTEVPVPEAPWPRRKIPAQASARASRTHAIPPRVHPTDVAPASRTAKRAPEHQPMTVDAATPPRAGDLRATVKAATRLMAKPHDDALLARSLASLRALMGVYQIPEIDALLEACGRDERWVILTALRGADANLSD